ncbi:hypothetical protein GCM10022415_15940 [Knoellia locipacati]|uniref:Uncharacterized protein n=1 Tax=Knoellia locipacati TaxID=882824 RepID=A0A512T050_9MICO|nr:hypothetical protein KLO01_15910 [Knoellia locipacati]
MLLGTTSRNAAVAVDRHYAPIVEAEYPSARVDEFEMGMFVSYDDCGDAWVKAPDGSLAGLIWETGEPAYFRASIAPDEARWGTYAVQLPLPLTSNDEAAAYLSALLPDLRVRWHEWARRQSG